MRLPLENRAPVAILRRSTVGRPSYSRKTGLHPGQTMPQKPEIIILGVNAKNFFHYEDFRIPGPFMTKSARMEVTLAGHWPWEGGGMAVDERGAIDGGRGQAGARPTCVSVRRPATGWARMARISSEAPSTRHVH